tara:strand:- start:341 stop:850 length:510 start_codon:yes stop_codon:yes gene_type:complete
MLLLFKKFKYLIIFLFLLEGFFSNVNATHHERNTDLIKIEELYKNWNSAVEASNIDGYIASLDKNITLLPPGGPILNGKENYKKFLGPVFESATYRLEEKGSNIEIVGDLAIVRKRTIVYLTFKEGVEKVSSGGALQENITDSNYFDILRRQDDGSWKCLVHSWKVISN